MNKVAKVLRGVLLAVTVGAVILLGLSFGPTLLGYESFIVTSGSMGAANPVGSVAVTRMVDSRAIRTGDVVNFQTKSASRITHRVIAVAEQDGQRVFTTKGDANPLPDPEPLRLSSGKVARVEWSVPLAGYVVRYARTPVGGIFLFAVPILGLLLDKRKRSQGISRRSVRAGDSHVSVFPSSLTLGCPHCGEGVALSLVPVAPPKPALDKRIAASGVQPKHIRIPKILSRHGSPTKDHEPDA